VFLDEENGFVTFLLYNLSGQIVGYQRYNPDGSKTINGRHSNELADDAKYFTYIHTEGEEKPREGKKSIGFWGLETVRPDDRLVFLTEGIFDAVKVHNAGYSALALLMNDPKKYRPWFRAMSKVFVPILDRDDASTKLRKLGDRYFVVPEPYHDLGEMPQGEADLFLDGAVQAIRSSTT